MVHAQLSPNSDAVSVSLECLEKSEVPFEILEEAFGPESLGILIVKDLPKRFVELRQKLLSYGSYLANLPSAQLERLTNPTSNYLSGWSHGKESLKSGRYDTMKGSFYVNCAFYQGLDFKKSPHPLSDQYPEFTSPNIWPEDGDLPGFQETYEQLCTLIIDVAILVARACDAFASVHIEKYTAHYLEDVVRSSVITKARLLHYFPTDYQIGMETEDDSWCSTHIDHGCLTGLTSAMYIDETAHPPLTSATSPPTDLPALPEPPDSNAGLYIYARNSALAKISIPSDCLAFQTGEALERITQGRFKAVPHFVKAPNTISKEMKVARNTLAVFTQPDLQDIVDLQNGMTFGDLSKEVLGRFEGRTA